MTRSRARWNLGSLSAAQLGSKRNTLNYWTVQKGLPASMGIGLASSPRYSTT